MRLQNRLLWLAVVCVLAISGAAVYIIHSHSKQQNAIKSAPTVATTDLASVLAGPHILFTNTALGSTYKMVAAVPLDDPSGPRAITKTSCERVYGAGKEVVCLASDPGIVTTYSAAVLNSDMAKQQALPLAGIPSRARLSADAQLVSTTSFVNGDSYAQQSFSTRTVISRVDGAAVGNLENFTLIHDGHSVKPPDRNYWGVTFAADDNTFYVTVAFSGHTWLARGDIRAKTVTTLQSDAECPSLSPDGTRIVYKQRGTHPPGVWRLVEYDIASGKITPLAETRSVDDQVAWLDDHTVMYGLPRSGSGSAVDDVWKVPADGSGKPQLLIKDAWSPAVVQ